MPTAGSLFAPQVIDDGLAVDGVAERGARGIAHRVAYVEADMA
jgi:hypothetical protein